MLVATIEIWPFGNEGEKREVSRVFIANTLERDFDGAHLYRVRVIQDGHGDFPFRFTEKDAAFYHHREDGAEVCVGKAIAAIESRRVQEKLENP